jgi:hypothetical protein
MIWRRVTRSSSCSRSTRPACGVEAGCCRAVAIQLQ